jgi:hypothetical protein
VRQSRATLRTNWPSVAERTAWRVGARMGLGQSWASAARSQPTLGVLHHRWTSSLPPFPGRVLSSNRFRLSRRAKSSP